MPDSHIAGLEKRARELEILAARTPSLFEQETVDDIYRTAGDILDRRLRYPTSIVALVDGHWVLKYSLFAHRAERAARRFAGSGAGTSASPRARTA